MRRILQSTPLADLTAIAAKVHATKGFTFDPKIIGFLISALSSNVNLAPDIKKAVSAPEEILLVWLQKIESGYSKRISKRKSNYPGTMPDAMVSKIIKARLTRLRPMDLQRINDAHRLSMSAENILGLFLEEFLFVSLKKYGWHCAWGECIRSVDFINETGALLQIKNRSNSENSSSSKVREGTSIEKWFRVDAISGAYNWTKLNQIIGSGCNLSEELFEGFVKNTLLANPDALAVETQNAWLS